MSTKSKRKVPSVLALALALLCLALLWATGAWAQQFTPPPPGYDMIGFIQEATLDTAHAICTPTDPLLAGGTITLNGIKMIIPCNTILQMPAAAFTWAQLFDPAVAASTGAFLGTVSAPGAGQTRLALTDNPMPFPSFEIRVQGNIVTDPVTGAQRYIVGLIVPLTQQGLNVGSGFITYIDYATGAIRVGGIPNDPNCVAGAVGGGPTCSGALVQFNDPVGRYGLPHSIDPRFTSDTNNPTIVAQSGYPVCIARVAPPAVDPLCPQTNRPLNGDPRFPVDPFKPNGAFLTTYDMPAPVCATGTGPGTATPCANTVSPDAYQQVPLELGDWIDYSGTLFKLNPLATLTVTDPVTGVSTAVPDNSAANSYISAHTVTANLGVFTAPGILPNYVYVETILIGTGGIPPAPLRFEATTRLTVVGFTTDPSRLVDINAVDVNPCTGAETLRLLAITDPATQGVRGRFVYRVLGGLFEPATREYIMVNEAGTLPNVANGLVSGQFRLPNFDFVGPEFFDIGAPVLSMNFQDIPFLAEGSGPLNGTGPIVGQLDPWPGSPAPPTAVCNGAGTAPIVSAGADITVATGSLVTLSGTAKLDPNSIVTLTQWVQTAGPTVALANANTLTPSFTAPAGSTQLTFQLTVTDQFGTSTDTVNVIVTTPTDTLTVTATWIAGKTGVQNNGKPVKNRNLGKITVTATSTDPTATLTAEEIELDGTVFPLGTLSPIGNPVGTFTISFDSVPQPFSVTVRSNRGGSATVTCGTVNAKGVSCP